MFTQRDLNFHTGVCIVTQHFLDATYRQSPFTGLFKDLGNDHLAWLYLGSRTGGLTRAARASG